VICPSCNEQNDPLALVCFACDFPLTGQAIRRGTVIGSRYEIRKWLGRGGMGTVYQAYDRVLEEDVAVKVLRPEVAASPDLTRRFRIEIKLARRVRHPNVCAIHEYGEDGDLRYISMELIEGTDLKKIIQKRGRLDRMEAFDVAVQMTEGLQAIHAIGVIHRDLKTANIMRDARGLVRLMDFGIAKQLGSEASASATATGHILGTPEYMSPEQARGDPLDPRSDIYALGIVIFEIFTGDVPFHGDTPVATLFKHLQDPPPLHDGRLPGGLARVLERALAKQTGDRHADAGELVADLVRARADAEAEAAEPIEATEIDSIPALAFDGPSRPGPTFVPPPTRTNTGIPILVDPLSRATAGATLDPAIPPTIRAPLTPTPPPRSARPLPPRPVSGGPPASQPRPRPAWLRNAILGAALAAGIILAVSGLGRLTGTPPVTDVAPTPAPPSTEIAGSGLTAAGTIESRAAAMAGRSSPAPERTAPRARDVIAPEPPPARVSPVAAVTPAGTARGARTTGEPVSGHPRVASPLPVLPWKPVATATSPNTAGQTAPAPAPPAIAGETGQLQVIARPWAEVTVDGAAVGTTPFRPLKLPAGSHTVLFSHPDYKPFRRQVVVRANETTRLEVDLPEEAFKK
jgi:serine/threonine-protein kinase